MLYELLLTVAVAISSAPSDQQEVIVVVGAPGSDEYAEAFAKAAEDWQAAAAKASAACMVIGQDAHENTTDRQRLQQALKAATTQSAEPLWLVFIGHGTFDGKVAKFNLRGPDVAAGDLQAWLDGAARPLAIIDCSSSSGPFINKLSGTNRVVVTSTKSGFQYNFSRFGKFISAAIADPEADLDKDQQTSLLEAFLLASSRVQEFYDQAGRLATEHALIDDNGDGRGTPADWFRGVRTTRAAKDGAAPDGLRANQLCLIRSAREEQMPPEVRKRRDALEVDIARLRNLKPKLPEPVYYEQLEALLIELAELYRDLPDASEPAASNAEPPAAKATKVAE